MIGRCIGLSQAAAWAIAGVVFVAVEIFSSGLWFLWLGLSSFLISLGLLIHLIPGSITAQILIFCILTTLFIFFTRPLAMRFFKTREVQSNVNALAGKIGLVLMDIDPLASGQVKLDGEVWTAKADQSIGTGQKVTVVSVEGVTLIVAPLQD